MNLHTERAELLPTSFHRSTSRAAGSTTNASTTIPSLHADDKDSIYTFSNDESDFMDNNGKFGSRLGSTSAMSTTPFASAMDKNLNDTRNFGLKETIRTYSKKKASSSTSSTATGVDSVSVRNERKRSSALATATTTTYSDTPSCSPLQSISSISLSPFSDESNPQTFKSNGNALIDQSSVSPRSPWVKKSPVSGGGKPKSFAMALNESIRKSAGRLTNERASTTAAAAAKVASSTVPTPVVKTTRGRPKRKALVAMYQSQLSDNTMGIKIRLKKSIEVPSSAAFGNNNNGGYANVIDAPAGAATAAAAVAVATTTVTTTNRQKKSAPTTTTTTTPVGSPTAAIGSTPSTSKPTRKRQRKSRHKADSSDSDDSDYEKRRKNNSTAMEKYRNRKQTTNTGSDHTEWHEPSEQSEWGNVIPEHVLLKIFEEAINQYGSLPTIINVGRVCSLWRRVSLTPHLWHTLDLSSWTKDRSEINLKRIIATHLRWCKDVNLADWKVTNIECVLERLLETCPNLEAISVSGWKEFTGDQLAFLVQKFKSLERIDLSSVNMELNPNRSAVGPQSLCSAIQTLGSRLTHLNLSHNRLAGIPQLITTLSTYCPSLSLLDLSNVSTVAASHGVLHIEKLQEGCTRMKVLRITSSQISLSAATLQEQMESPGFPELEELSVASLADESRLMNDEFLQRILKTSTKLKLLDVRGCARLTHDTLIRLPTWDLKHLFLSGCSVTRDIGSGLELIASKWAHSLIELDLAWANVQDPLDNAIKAIAEKGDESPLNHLNLCGSSVSLEAVKEILSNCRYLNSINLASCRGLPRGVKRLMHGTAAIDELRENLGVKLKYAAVANRVADQSFDSTSQSATPNSSADIVDN